MPPKSSEETVLDYLFNEFHTNEYPEETADDTFELYSAYQVLKPRNISDEELAAGIVDGGKDSGLDSFFVFVNDTNVSPDDPLLTPNDASVKRLGQHPHLEIFLIQSKNSRSWSESAWEHLLSALPNLLDVNAQDAALESSYNTAVVERTGILRRAIISLGPKFPRIDFHLVYASRAPEENITNTIRMRAEQVTEVANSQLPVNSKVTASHIGIEGLYTLAGTDYSEPGVLAFKKVMRLPKAYLGLVTLENYLKFVRSEDGSLREELFDSNVRDYEGDNLVNEAIKMTLATEEETEFWWLNNGVTVLANEVGGPEDTLTVSKPLIVNGLQTTHVLDQAQKDGSLVESRLQNSVVVRVIETDDEDTRDKIIAGTNRQTQVPSVALYATQELQRDIERFLHARGWFYERRKNRYKNQSKPAKRRITINLLAQAMMTLNLGRPDAARARPSTVLSRKGGYESVFPAGLNKTAYLTAVEIIKAVDDFLRTDEAKKILNEYSNARFYTAAGYVILALSISDPRNFHFSQNFHRLTVPLDGAKLKTALRVLATTADTYQKANPSLSRDSIFKNADFRDKYFFALARQHRQAGTS